jgi:hypothetical protein
MLWTYSLLKRLYIGRLCLSSICIEPKVAD